MSFEGDIRAVLLTACPRVFPDVAPVSTQRPYVTYHLYGGEVINPLGNEAPGKRNAYVQVNVWSGSRLEANAMSRQIEDAMRSATTFQARPMEALSADYDHDSNVYSAAQDFTCWY